MAARNAIDEPDEARRQDIARRFRAARELAGYTSVPKFTKAIKSRGLAQTTLYKLQQGKWPEDGREDKRTLRYIAEFCGLPPAWFDVDIVEAVRREGERIGAPAIETVPSEMERAASAARPDAQTEPGENASTTGATPPIPPADHG